MRVWRPGQWRAIQVRLCPNCRHLMAASFCNNCPGDPDRGLGPQTTHAVRYNKRLGTWQVKS